MYGDRLNVLMMANMLHVRFVGRYCPVEAVQHLRSGNNCVYGIRRRPLAIHSYPFINNHDDRTHNVQ